MPRAAARRTNARKSARLPRSGCTASWPPSAPPIAHGEPGSCGPGSSVLLRPLRFVTPIGWMGGRYTTSKPIAATPSRRFAAVRKVPLFQLPSFRRRAPSERGKNSYHAPTPARRRSTRISCSGESVVSSASGHAAKTSSAGASTSARRSAADAAVSRSPAASALRRRRVATGRDFSATARSMSRAPISYMSSASTPASIFSAASCRHVATSSSNPVTCQCQTPCSSSSASASHRSVPGASGDIRSWRTWPDGLGEDQHRADLVVTLAEDGRAERHDLALEGLRPPPAVGQGGRDPRHWDSAGEHCVGGHVPTVARNRLHVAIRMPRPRAFRPTRRLGYARAAVRAARACGATGRDRPVHTFDTRST